MDALPKLCKSFSLGDVPSPTVVFGCLPEVLDSSPRVLVAGGDVIKTKRGGNSSFKCTDCRGRWCCGLVGVAPRPRPSVCLGGKHCQQNGYAAHASCKKGRPGRAPPS